MDLFKFNNRKNITFENRTRPESRDRDKIGSHA